MGSLCRREGRSRVKETRHAPFILHWHLIDIAHTHDGGVDVLKVAVGKPPCWGCFWTIRYKETWDVGAKEVVERERFQF